MMEMVRQWTVPVDICRYLCLSVSLLFLIIHINVCACNRAGLEPQEQKLVEQNHVSLGSNSEVIEVSPDQKEHVSIWNRSEYSETTQYPNRARNYVNSECDLCASLTLSKDQLDYVHTEIIRQKLKDKLDAILPKNQTLSGVRLPQSVIRNNGIFTSKEDGTAAESKQVIVLANSVSMCGGSNTSVCFSFRIRRQLAPGDVTSVKFCAYRKIGGRIKKRDLNVNIPSANVNGGSVDTLGTNINSGSLNQPGANENEDSVNTPCANVNDGHVNTPGRAISDGHHNTPGADVLELYESSPNGDVFLTTEEVDDNPNWAAFKVPRPLMGFVYAPHSNASDDDGNSFTEVRLKLKCNQCEGTEISRSANKAYLDITLAAARPRAKRSGVECLPSISRCCRVRLYVSFREIGFRTISQPPGFYANYCAGSCRGHHTPAHQNAHIIMGLTDSQRRTANNQYVSCCSPVRLSPIDIIVPKGDDNFEKETMPDMSVDTCGCA